MWKTEKGLGMKKLDIIMSARQMNVHYIYITYVRVTEIEVVNTWKSNFVTFRCLVSPDQPQ